MAKKFDFNGLKGKVIHKLRIRGKLLRKVVLLVVLLSVIPLLVSGFLFLHISENLTERNAKKLQLEIAQRAAAEIDDYIANVEGKISVATKTKGFLAGDEARQKWMLEVLFKEIPALSQIVLVDTIGKE
ncbi:MAG: hypothetical protein Q8M92_02590, partial [Candidatus Subteraquimicrobiales bacterium]|nr:hypothetical protein [Candidatus Subteraquimicrobiales bacterium]